MLLGWEGGIWLVNLLKEAEIGVLMSCRIDISRNTGSQQPDLFSSNDDWSGGLEHSYTGLLSSVGWQLDPLRYHWIVIPWITKINLE